MPTDGGSRTARLLSLLIALQVWTVVGLGLFLLDPGGVDARLPCSGRILSGAACADAQAAVTDAWLTFHYWPLIGTIVLGYAAIVLLFLRGPRPRTVRRSDARRARRPVVPATARRRR